MAQYELTLRDYIRIFHKRKIVIVIIFLVITVGGFLFSLGGLPSYDAQTTVKIEEQNSVSGVPSGWGSYGNADVMESQAKLIYSHEVMKKVAFALGEVTADASQDAINKAISTIQGKIKTERIGYTNIIKITANADTADKAINLANTVAGKYQEHNLLEKTLEARSKRNFIQSQLSSLEERLEFKEERVKELEEYVRNVSISDSMKRRLADLEFQLTELLQKYTEKHPRVVQTQDQIAELKSQGNNEDVKLLEYERLKRELDADKKLYSMLKEKLEEAKINEAQKVGDVFIVNPAVEAVLVSGTNKVVSLFVGAILGLVLSFTFAVVLESLDTSIATIEGVENIIKVPVLGVVPSIIGKEPGGAHADVFARLKRRIFNKPKTEEEERYIHLLIHYDHDSPIAEVYRNIGTNLKLDGSKKTILVTSAGPREGKSTLLVNLGHAIAQSGKKTILISSDIRRPVLAKTFGIPREPGLTEVLLGMTSLDAALRNVTDFMLGEIGFEEIRLVPGLDNLWLLTSGQLPFNPAKIFESKELLDLIAELKKRFDIVIFDSPPILPVTDASIIAPKMDMVIMVYEIGRTSRDALFRAKSQLDSVGANTVGVVLNQTRGETAETIVHPYYYKYKYSDDEKA
ncbi:MAG: polysaccharide biosynthesis tyrosine autokinase [Candidatus Omnitrophica bacterium]|nr:polysaccharide biosynthesis tyrosine autokinase [Candidatus Omnitrophota bacterium]